MSKLIEQIEKVLEKKDDNIKVVDEWTFNNGKGKQRIIEIKDIHGNPMFQVETWSGKSWLDVARFKKLSDAQKLKDV